MSSLAVGFWGAFFGVAGLALAAALIAFRRSVRRIAMTGSLAALLSALYVIVFLGWVPVADPELLQRLQALTAIASAAVLAALLFALLGTFRKREAIARSRRVIAGVAAASVVAAWLAPPRQALEIGMLATVVMSFCAAAAAVGSVRRGERAGWLALAALLCMSVAMLGVDAYALHPEGTPWQLHALSASAGIAYLVCIATAMWTRYSYLIEVSAVMRQGPDFDPVTRMPAYEAGRPAAEVFPGFEGKPCAIIAVSVANLKLLEELQGRAAYNHALFVCASRLRRLLLPGVEVGRLREDSFVLLFHHAPEVQVLIDHARQVIRRLSRPVLLGTQRDMQHLEASAAAWEAQVGLGLAIENAGVQLEVAIAGARAMSRSAWSYASRMAWYDEAAQGISELPAAD